MIVSSSSGYTVRRSTTSADTPSCDRSSAASSALWTIAPYVTIDTSVPSRLTSALPMGTRKSGSSDTFSRMRR